MSTWNSPPQIPPYKEPPFGATAEQQTEGLTAYLKQLANVVSALKNDLEFMLNGNLDVKNIRAKGITADRMDVNELSAISANLGHITAGLIEAVQIFGSYIATSQNTYPRCEMSGTGNLFGAFYSPNTFIRIVPNFGNTPALEFYANGIFQGRFHMLLASGIESDGPFRANGVLYTSGWNNVRAGAQSLQDVLNSFQIQLNSKLSGNGAYGGFYVSTTPGGPADTFVSVSNGLISS